MGQVSAYHFLNDGDSVMNKRGLTPFPHKDYIPVVWSRYYYPWIIGKETEAQKYNNWHHAF